MKKLKPGDVEVRGSQVVLMFEDDGGETYELELDAGHALSLSAAINAQAASAFRDPAAVNDDHPMIHHLQYRGDETAAALRVYLSPEAYHEYGIPPRTQLARDLEAAADRAEQRQWDRATNRPPDTRQ